MRIRRFEAPDTRTALTMVKKEMGENAVILSTKYLKKMSRPGRNGRPWLEVVAAMDHDIENLTSSAVGHESGSSMSAYGSYNGNYVGDQVRNDAPAYISRLESSYVSTPGRSSLSDTLSDEVRTEADELRSRFAHRIQQPHNSNKVGLQNPAVRSNKPDPMEVARWRDQLIEKIKLRPLALGKNGSPKVIALVGATGVGKTTTAAKVAAWFALREQKSVALISMDCYRIGATDQLRTYAKIMQINCEVVLKPKDLNMAIEKNREKDLIIIDTAGKNPYDPNHVQELKHWFSTDHRIDCHLVVAATSKKEDIAAVIKSYSPLEVEGLVVTKLDETRAYAGLCQQLAISNLPLSCLCTGQRVPEDFMLASKSFTDKLFKQGWPAVESDLKAFAANM